MYKGLVLNILLYADDMVLIADNEKDLQTLLDILHQWCHKWRLSVNIDKTQVVHFRPSRKKGSNVSFKYGSSSLKTVSSYKYLGIILDEHLNFKECVKTLATAGGRALGGIISKFKTFKNVGYRTFTKLYYSGVSPILEYSAGVWGYVKAKEIDHIQNRAFRYFLGVNKFCPIAGMQGDMGWVSQYFDRYTSIIRFWNKMILMGNDRITKKIFNWDYDKPSGWCSEVKTIFNSLGLSNYHSDQIVCDLRIIKNKVREKMANEWRAEVDSKPKLRTYRLFKKEFKISDSVFINNRMKRSLLSQFRFGVLPLRIETGRWYRGIEVNERICEICNNGDIEDEVHFLIKCNAYSNIRRLLFDKCISKEVEFQNFDDIDKLIFITNNMERDLANYLASSWNVRRNYLYN